MPKKLFVEQTDDAKIQFFRYFFVGGAAFFIDFLTLYILTSVLDIHYLISNVVGFLFGLTTNYLLSIKWVFAQRKMDNRKKEFIAFASIGFVGLLINQFVMWLMTEQMVLFYLYSKIVATGIVFLWNFFGRRYIVFY